MAAAALRSIRWLLAFAATTLAADIKGSIGWTGFADEGIEDHLLTGVSIRIPLTRRFAIEPELLYLKGSGRHYDVVLIPNLVWQWGRGIVRPYVTGGIGFMYSRGNFGFSGNSAFVSGGFGAKVYLNDRWFLAPDARIGWEPHIRFSGGTGYSW